MNNKKILAFLISLSFPMISNATTQNTIPKDPVYECTTEETSSYIKVSNANLYTPSMIPTVEELNNEFLKEQAKKEDSNCLALFSGDFDLGDEWDKLIDKLSSIDVGFTSLNGAFLKAIEEAYNKVKDKVMEEINKGICSRIDPEKIKDIASDLVNDKIKDRTGIDITDLSGFAEGLAKDALDEKLHDMVGSDKKYFYNPNEIGEDVKADAKDKLSSDIEDFWKNI